MHRLKLIGVLIIGSCFYALSAHSQEATSLELKRMVHLLINKASKEGIADKLSAWPVSESIKADFDQWTAVYAEALYHTKPWRLSSEGPSADTVFNYTSADFRFTEREGVVYAFAMGNAGRDIRIKSLNCTSVNKPIATVSLVGSNERLSWEQREADLLIDKPLALQSIVTVFKITFQDYYQP